MTTARTTGSASTTRTRGSCPTSCSRSAALLSSSSDRAYLAHVDLTTPDLFDEDTGELVAPQQTLNLRRIRTINGRLFERIRVKNYNPRPVHVDVGMSFGADFADVFEVRGLARETTASISR